MVNVRRLGTAAAVVAAVALVGAQVASAAPAAKVGTSYWTGNGADVTANGLIITSMRVPAGKYHVSATVVLENNDPSTGPGAYISRVSCQLFAYGVESFAETSLGAGGFATVALQVAVDATRANPDAFMDVECWTDDPTASPLPHAAATIVADAMAGIVDLR